ncbi:MAG: hypothetical protein U1E67_04715 [Hyphomicrobiales bacterium]
MIEGYQSVSPREIGSSTKRAVVLVVLVGTGSLITYIAKAQSVEILKPVAVTLYAAALVSSIDLLKRYWFCIDVWRAVLVLFIVSFVPAVRIIAEALAFSEWKQLSDGLFIIGPYYSLPLVGLGLIALLAARGVQLSTVLIRYLFIVTPLILVLTSLGYYFLDPGRVGPVYSASNNLLIVGAGLLIFRGDARTLAIGLLSASCLAAICIAVGARSYLLLVLYLCTFAMLSRISGLSGRIVTLVIVAIIFAVLTPSEYGEALRNESVSDLALFQKLRMESLGEALGSFLSTGDFWTLYNWEGNSRAGILTDAFWDFGIYDWLWGRGVFATYQSFVDRNTIEIGYAQELFWFGAVHVLMMICFSSMSLLQLWRFVKLSKNGTVEFLAAFIAIKLLDSLVYGMPTYDTYGLLFWSAVMFWCLKPEFKQYLSISKVPTVLRYPIHRSGRRVVAS